MLFLLCFAAMSHGRSCVNTSRRAMDMARTRPWVVPVVLLASVLLCTHHVAGVVLEPESEKVANTNSTNSTPVPLIWIIPHSHDDTGWQRTVDQYHVEDVRNILTETVKALKANRNRTFVEVRLEDRPPACVFSRGCAPLIRWKLHFLSAGGWNKMKKRSKMCAHLFRMGSWSSSMAVGAWQTRP